jgi:sugar lactone lactonase YvrE
MSRLTITLLVLGLVGCVRATLGTVAPPGTERGPCLPDGTCEPGLDCLSDLCVRPGGTDAFLTPDGDPHDLGQPRSDLPNPDPSTDGAGPIAAGTRTLAGTTGVTGYMDGPVALARFSAPHALAVDLQGRIYVADTDNHRIRRIDNDQVITLAGSGTPGWADGPALTAQLNAPRGVGLTTDGTVYVADTGNHRIRKIVSGQVLTVAGDGTPGQTDGAVNLAQLNTPSGVAVDPWGAVYVADTGNNRIRKVHNGKVTTPISSGLSAPTGVAVDSVGIVYVADSGNHRVLKLLAGKLTAVAGGAPGFLDGDGKWAKFKTPTGLCLDQSGTIYVADRDNHSIRRILAGKVTTLAGNGTKGYAEGQGAKFNSPYDIAASGAGKVVVVDTGNHLVRMITF